jgi:hypothetical protein
MAEAVRSLPRPRADTARLGRVRRRHDDLWIATTALLAAVLVLPFAQSTWHGAEASAILAVSATAMFAGQRWAIAPVVLAELMLLPTLWPRAFETGWHSATAIAALVTLAAIVPGVLAMRRAAAALALVTGRRRTRTNCRRFHAGLVAVGILVTLLPVIS